jgi:hypothetical protein
MSKDNTKTSNLWDIIKDLKAPVIPKPEFPEIEIENMDELEAKFAEEAEIRKLQLESLRQQVGTSSGVVIYNPVSSVISFLGKNIKVVPDTTQAAICKLLFKNKSSQNKEWPWDEIVDKMGDEGRRKKRSIYDAARQLNIKIAAETAVQDVLLVTTKTIQLNPKYLSK